MIRQNKLAGYVERLRGDKRPITADIFLTDFCNAKCGYCRYNHETGRYIHFEDFKKYVNRLISLGVNGIILTGGGEPTINPDFNKIIGWLNENNIPYGINTNLIKPIECAPVFLKVSIDAGDGGRYKALRGVDRLGAVLRNLGSFIDYKKVNNLSTKIGVQCVAINKEDVLSFYDAIKPIDVDYIYIRPLEQIGGHHVTEIDVRQWLNGIKDERINISFKFGLRDYRPKSCLANWSVITVNCDGNVPYCCHFPNDIVGNIMDDDILIKKSTHHVDMCKCETPCRLSGANYYLEMNELESDVVFV